MLLCAVQTRPITGDVRANLEAHGRLAELAVARGAEMIVFPELSLTGYEPTLAAELAVAPDDGRFDVLQAVADQHTATLLVGMPTRVTAAGGVYISLLVFAPGAARRTYSKQYLHADEVPFFVPGEGAFGLLGGDAAIAPAICYELSVSEHAEAAARAGARAYVASVAKTAGGVVTARRRLATIAADYGMAAVLANAVGPADGGECAGRTSAWRPGGTLAGELDERGEGLLLVDLESGEATAVRVAPGSG